MDYEFWFWIGIAFILGRISCRPIFYIGNDKEKYEKAYIAILLRNNTKHNTYRR